jgi:multimeric flavodoxin WrbA
MKTLIINGSPRPNGDTAALIAKLRENLSGEVTEISAFRANIAPCIDCRKCETQLGCVIRDDMDIVLGDYDIAVIASPVYYGVLPGAMLSLMSRFQFIRSAKYKQQKTIDVTPKTGAVILTAGSKGNSDGAVRLSRVMLRMLGASLYDENIIILADTDTTPAKDNSKAAGKIRKLADALTLAYNRKKLFATIKFE